MDTKDKKTLDDIKTDVSGGDNGRSIQNVHMERAGKNNHTPPPPPGRSPRSFGSRRPRWLVWGGGALLVIILIFLFSSVFSGTKILAEPRSEHVVVDGTFQSVKSAQTQEDLQYEIMSVTQEAFRDVGATGEAFVEEKASGEITVYNDYNTQPQKLIQNTRFETPEGRVYRIRGPIVVPGQRETDGKTVPGSITVTVYADEAGEEYNVGKTNFTIPGLKGSDQYDYFYARSETPMTGGFEGMKKTVSKEARDNAVGQMRAELRENILEEARAQKPDGFVLYEDAVFLEFSPLSDSLGENGKARIRERIALKSVIVDKQKLSAHIARRMLAEYDESPVEIVGLDEMTFNLQNKDAILLSENPTIVFTLSGQGDIVWLYDEASLRSSLLGQSRSSIELILKKYPSIQEAEVIVRPFWRRSLPTNPEKITIERVIEN